MGVVRHTVASMTALFAGASISVSALAAPAPPLPGSADVGRLERRAEPQSILPALPAPVTPRTSYEPEAAPPASHDIKVTLTGVSINGMTAYSGDEIKSLYREYLDRQTTLDVAWIIAARLTERYHQDGYFLTRVTIPEQELKDGVLRLQVTEGFIEDVRLNDPLSKNRIVKQWLARLKAYRPLKASQIESVLLHLNDLPGVNLRAVLEPIKSLDDPGAVRLVLEPKSVHRLTGQISVDDYASRYLGPLEVIAQAQLVTAPTLRTTASALSTMTSNEVLFGYLRQEIPLFAGATLELSLAHASSTPGYTLKKFDEVSDLMTYSAAIDYSIIRQRQENLSARLEFDARDISTNTFGNIPQTRDRIRVLSLEINFNATDRWRGQTTIDAKTVQGLDVLGASPAQTPGSLANHLSRADAKPAFTKFDLDISRTQALNDHFAIVVSGAAQLTASPLYASEQFGYGGEVFGRAYSDSEITGDEGVNGSVELRYFGLPQAAGAAFMPYGFYDIGRVWNNRQYLADAFAESGSSTGVGLRIASTLGITANIGVAIPLTRRQTAPIYGNGKNARPFFKLAYGF